MLQLLLVILDSLAGCLFLLVFFSFFKWKSEHSPCVALKEISHNCSQQKACFKMKALSKTPLGFHTCSRTDVGIVMKQSLLLFGVPVMVHSLEQLETRLCCTGMVIRCSLCSECDCVILNTVLWRNILGLDLYWWHAEKNCCPPFSGSE